MEKSGPKWKGKTKMDFNIQFHYYIERWLKRFFSLEKKKAYYIGQLDSLLIIIRWSMKAKDLTLVKNFHNHHYLEFQWEINFFSCFCFKWGKKTLKIFTGKKTLFSERFLFVVVVVSGDPSSLIIRIFFDKNHTIIRINFFLRSSFFAVIQCVKILFQFVFDLSKFLFVSNEQWMKRWWMNVPVDGTSKVHG